MPDSWSLVTPSGAYQLNPSFAAPKYQPGSVSGPGALRRDERTTYQRSGDGLRTPGPLTLIGRVWRDDQDQALMLQELEAIRAAVATCTAVTRSNNAGEYVYDSLAGGATPEITPDGLGGWIVKLDLWPGRAEPTFIPAPEPVDPVDILAASVVGIDQGAGLLTLNIPGAPAPTGALVLVVIGSENSSGEITSAPGLTNANGQNDLEPVHEFTLRVWAFTRVLSAPQSTIEITFGDWAWGTAHIVVMTGATGVADILATSHFAEPSLSVAGASTQAGTQFFMGNFLEYGIG